MNEGEIRQLALLEFIISKRKALDAEIEGMKICNIERLNKGHSPAYDEKAFLEISVKYIGLAGDFNGV
jgi:hypothetical protein